MKRISVVYIKLFLGLLFFTLGACIYRRKEVDLYFVLAAPVIVNIGVIFYVHYRKKQFSNKFLQHTYNPSNILFVTSFVFELAGILGYLIGYKLYILGGVHVGLVTLCYFYIFINRKKNRMNIRSNFRMKFEYGILNENIPHSPLHKGAFVKIQKKLPNSYIVRDYENNEYEIEKELLGNIQKISM